MSGVGERMQSTDEHPQPLLKLRRKRAVAELQLTGMADPNPGPFGGGGSIVRGPQPIGQHQVSMESHGQVTIAARPGKGGPRGEQQCLLIDVGFHLPVPATEEFDRGPAGIHNHAGVTDADARAIGAMHVQRLIRKKSR